MLFGLTGGIGCGKTTIAGHLQKLGYPVFYTDDSARQLINNNPCVRSQVELLFGSDIYQNNELNRSKVANMVFNDNKLLEQFNQIVHPAVKYEIVEWSKNKQICFVESAILFESGINIICDATIAITAPEKLRIERACVRDGKTASQIRQRIKNQISETERNNSADFVVDNDGSVSIEYICEQIVQFCNKKSMILQKNYK